MIFVMIQATWSGQSTTSSDFCDDNFVSSGESTTASDFCDDNFVVQR